ncbi:MULTISPECIES: hypothetical protein [Nitrosomonas]|uniref:Uncharacterized protein n=1 Tax=Nitrosomonas communis TaxID=44574 RepID=A0A0F7KHY8_9PROT|nr:MULTISPECIES: hypothetical protein [Nitrosomonas]AKH38449.1 hypothetical protein AAW31_12635 [Nitrosomonas communis]TYP69669.1 hypothetical protein BCL69_11393 [Nitrosomonas communis]UVS60479.1 hypothetical protein NX761_13310 [Nitrosomonas sp. PLL12]
MVEPDVKWAVYPWDEGKVAHSETLCESLCDSSYTLPGNGDLIMLPCLVNPETYEPIPVRVVEVWEYPEIDPPVLIFVVTPAGALN